ncbi:hypothetical protein H0H93_012663 [Arthromyces matolae]|nr:hypothetical protein H0H93_012663 [Arthromyces matolae]
MSRRIIVLKRTTLTLCICIVIALITVVQCSCSFVVTVQWGVLGAVRGAEHKTPVIVWLVGSTACDIAIALTMTYVLHTAKTAHMFMRTQNLIDKLIFQVVQSGAITAGGAVVDMGCLAGQTVRVPIFQCAPSKS